MKPRLAQHCLSFSCVLGVRLFQLVSTVLLIVVLEPMGHGAYPKLETGRPAIRNFLPNEYHAHDQNTGAVQDSRGLVYFGNRNLILEYDGENWRQIPVPNADLIHGIAIDGSDRIYVGGFNELGYIDNRSRTEKTFVSLSDRLPSEDRDFREVWDIHATPQGVYFAASQRLFRWFNDQFKVWRLPASARLSTHWVGNRLYVAQPGVGLMRLDGDSLTLISSDPIFSGERQVPLMLPRADGSILVCTFHHGLFLLRENQVSRLASDVNAFLKENQPNAGVLLKNGSIAIATLLGGVLVLRSDGSFQSLIDESVGLQTNRVHSILEDRLGCLWLSFSYGVSRVELLSPVSIFGSHLGLKHSFVHSVLRYNGELFAGTDSGLYRLEPDKNIPGMARFRLVDGLHDSIWKLEDHPGGLLAAGSNGVYRIQGGKSQRIYPPASSGDLGAMHVVLRSKFHPERVFIGGFNGLFSLRYENQRWRDEGQVKDVDAEVRSIVESEHGDLWLGTLNSGVVRVSFQADTVSQRGSAQVRRYDVSDGLPLNHGRIRVYPFNGRELFATNRGVYRFDSDAQKFVPDSVFGQRFVDGSTVVESLTWDSEGRVWLLTSQDATLADSRARPQILCGTFQADGTYAWKKLPAWTNNILGSVEGLSWDSISNVLWCGTREGLLRFDLTLLPVQEPRLATWISAISSPGRPLLSAETTPGQQPPIFDHNHNSIHFEYATPELLNGDKSEYQTWLEGFETSWSGFSAQEVRNYTNLREGNYLFKVRARNEDGRLSEVDTFAFSVLPPWYRTVWAYLFFTFCFGSIVFGSAQLRWRSLERRNQELQARVTARTAELDHKNEELAAKVKAVRLSEQQAQEEKEKAVRSEQKALEASHAKSVFLTNMSHELRTPLNAILGFAQLMEREKERSAKDREQLAIIMRSGEHLLGLINDVLSISKIEAGKQTLNAQVFGLGRLLKGLEEIFTPRTRAKGLYLKFEPAPELPQFVLGDEGKLRQVLINLLGNAVKFTEAGGITLRARWREGIGGFDIEDTGPGISEAEQKAIFEPFAQSRSGVDSKQGTGLGLTISRNFVQLMGGDLCVKSIEGQGSTFSFEINLSACNEIEEGSEERKVIGLEPGQPSYRILVADDRWENRALLVKLLATTGFVIREAVDGNEVVETWRTWQPHLIWMDVRMPGMDGLEATRTIRSAEANQGLSQLNDAPPGREVGQLPKSDDWARCVIIALTASAFEHHRVAILAAGCDDFVTKPFRTATVFEKLVKHLGVRFVYDEPEIASSARQAESGAAMGRLASLPEQWIEELAQAAAIGDDQAAHRIVDQIAEKDDGLGRELRRMVKRFEFEQIARWIGEALK